MGDDGTQDLLEMRNCGAQAIAEDESSCVVFGMPKEAIARGAVMAVVPLRRIAEMALTMAGCIGHASGINKFLTERQQP